MRSAVNLSADFLAGRYETVIGTHLDKAHPHNHIVFNACSYADGRMFQNDFNDYYNGIRTVSDALCREYGLSVIEPQNKGKQYREWLDEKEKKAHHARNGKSGCGRSACRRCQLQTFVLGLQRRGYIVKYGRKSNIWRSAIKRAASFALEIPGAGIHGGGHPSAAGAAAAASDARHASPAARRGKTRGKKKIKSPLHARAGPTACAGALRPGGPDIPVLPP